MDIAWIFPVITTHTNGEILGDVSSGFKSLRVFSEIKQCLSKV